jgi:hypothetical protein
MWWPDEAEAANREYAVSGGWKGMRFAGSFTMVLGKGWDAAEIGE